MVLAIPSFCVWKYIGLSIFFWGWQRFEARCCSIYISLYSRIDETCVGKE